MKKMKPFAKPLSGRKRFQRLLGSGQKKLGLRAGRVALKPQESVGAHSTRNKEEIIIILAGKARVNYHKKGVFFLRKNTFAYLPSHTVHNVVNIGRGLLQYIYITSRRT